MPFLDYYNNTFHHFKSPEENHLMPLPLKSQNIRIEQSQAQIDFLRQYIDESMNYSSDINSKYFSDIDYVPNFDHYYHFNEPNSELNAYIYVTSQKTIDHKIAFTQSNRLFFSDEAVKHIVTDAKSNLHGVLVKLTPNTAPYYSSGLAHLAFTAPLKQINFILDFICQDQASYYEIMSLKSITFQDIIKPQTRMPHFAKLLQQNDCSLERIESLFMILFTLLKLPIENIQKLY